MGEADFLNSYDQTTYQRPSVAVDVVLMGLRDGRPAVLLLQRRTHPFIDHWALPGAFVQIDETLEAAAARVLREKAAVIAPHCEQLYTFGALDRDPRMRIITVAWLALLSEDAFTAALAANPALLPATLDVPWDGETGGPVRVLSPQGEVLPLAFDHGAIIALAIQRLRGKLAYSEVGFSLLPELFTLRQLQSVHEAILGTPLNKPAFRRRMLDKGWLAATGQREDGASFRPAELFRFHRPL